MTAPNNPTPEVERYELINLTLKGLNIRANTEWPDMLRQCAAAIAKLTAERDAFEARLISCDENLTHTLKSYTEMTLERDRAERRVKELEEKINILHGKIEYYAECEGNALNDLEAAENRAKELEAKLKRITAIGEDNLEKLKSYIDATPAIEAANKLLSERAAVLENALEPFAKAASAFDGLPEPRYFGDTDFKLRYSDDDKATITVGDLRRARAAREAK